MTAEHPAPTSVTQAILDMLDDRMARAVYGECERCRNFPIESRTQREAACAYCMRHGIQAVPLSPAAPGS